MACLLLQRLQVKMSLEDLQNQMDKHQQLRERTDGKRHG